MDGGQLHRLGRRLVEISREATGSPNDPRMTAGEQAVLEDVLVHRGATISALVGRTGFVQSHVSQSVTRLHARGLVDTSVDPADRRRTMVRPTPIAVEKVVDRGARSIDTALAAVLPDPAAAARAAALLDELATLLLPAGASRST